MSFYREVEHSFSTFIDIVVDSLCIRAHTSSRWFCRLPPALRHHIHRLSHDSLLKAHIPSSRSYYNLHTFRFGGSSHSHAYIITAFRQHSQLFIHIAIIINLSSPHLIHQTTEKRVHVLQISYIVIAFLQISLFSTLPGVFLRFRLGSYIVGMYKYHHLQGCR
jgi:hypothetical protein